MSLILTTTGSEETQRTGALLGELLRPGDVVLLEGPLGAGKTTLTQGIARGMGIESPVTSPTFLLVNQYPGRTPLFHIDLYRIESAADALDLGLEEYFFDGGACVVEWPERAPEAMPQEYLRIALRHADDDRRDIQFEPQGARYRGLVEALAARLQAGGGG